MPRLWVNGTLRELPEGATVSSLLAALALDPRTVAVERNREVVPRADHPDLPLDEGDRVEIVTLVGGGSGMPDWTALQGGKWRVGPFSLSSRLIVGTGKYATPEIMRACHQAAEAEVVTIAVRRERLVDKAGNNILEAIAKGITLLPNTAGCYSAEDAVRVARLGRELLQNCGNPGHQWVKLEVLGDPRTLLPDPVATLEATRTLVADGFCVLVYSSDDPIIARRLQEAGAASVMPAGSPIGSGQGVLNPNNIRIILEVLKGADPHYPVIVDAGVGTASDVAVAMELGCDAVLLNTGIAGAKEPLRMAHAMLAACRAGRAAHLAGRIPRKLYASASTPDEGRIAATPS